MDGCNQASKDGTTATATRREFWFAILANDENLVAVILTVFHLAPENVQTSMSRTDFFPTAAILAIDPPRTAIYSLCFAVGIAARDILLGHIEQGMCAS
jgi:hypothetical protein